MAATDQPEISSAVIAAEEELIAAKRSVFHEESTGAIVTDESQDMDGTSDDKLVVPENSKTESNPNIPTEKVTPVIATRKEITLNFAIGAEAFCNGDGNGIEKQAGLPSSATAPPTVPLVACRRNRVYSAPGAYPQDSPFSGSVAGQNENSAREQSSGESSLHNSHQIVIEEEPDSRALAEAEPVALPSVTAEPVLSSDQAKASPHRKPCMWGLLGLAFLLVVIGTVLAVLLVGKDNTKEDPPRFNPNNELAAATNTTQDSSSNNANSVNFSGEDEFWDWDLPFQVPDATRVALEEDIDHITPVSKAFEWMKLDPYLDTYTSDRQLQRFVLSLFYHSTGGDAWVHKGDKIAKVMIDTGEFLNPFYKQRGQDRRRLTSRKEYQQEQLPRTPITKEEGDSKPRQLEPSAGPNANDCRGSVIQGGVEEVSLSSHPWLSHDHSECSWFSTAPTANLTVCNSNQRLAALDLESNMIFGSLPAQITLLTSLKVINLRRNKLQGTLFTNIGTLPYLRDMNFQRNLLTGEVPSEVGNLSNLRRFEVSVNQLTGSLPEELWALGNLEYLHAGENQLSGSIPPHIGSLSPKLGSLVLRRNRLFGTIPPSIGGLSTLFRLAIFDNYLSGQLPTEVGMLSRLKWILLENNELTGTVPSELGKLKLCQLKLSNMAGITGQIPAELALLNTTLTNFDLRGTSITGTIPEALCGVGCLMFDCSKTLCGCGCPCV